MNDTLVNESIAGIPWLPLSQTHPADRYTSVTDGVAPEWDADLAFHLTRAYHGKTDRSTHAGS